MGCISPFATNTPILGIIDACSVYSQIKNINKTYHRKSIYILVCLRIDFVISVFLYAFCQ